MQGIERGEQSRINLSELKQGEMPGGNYNEN